MLTNALDKKINFSIIFGILVTTQRREWAGNTKTKRSFTVAKYPSTTKKKLCDNYHLKINAEERSWRLAFLLHREGSSTISQSFTKSNFAVLQGSRGVAQSPAIGVKKNFFSTVYRKQIACFSMVRIDDKSASYDLDATNTC